MHFHHPLLIEFAQYRDVILRLKEEREDFRRMADEYHAIDRHVCRIERELEPATDQEIEELKFKRLRLKDKLYHEILMTAHGHIPDHATA